MTVANPAYALRAIREGFHRHDRAPHRALSVEGQPLPGEHVKLQLTLHVALAPADRPDDSTDWLAMGGTIKQVLGPDRVIAELVATTDRAPQDFDGIWTAELRREPDVAFPWMLTSLAPAFPIAQQVGARDEVEGTIQLKIACEGAGVQAALRELAVAVGAEPPPSIVFLPLALARFSLWLTAVAPELDEVDAAHELLLNSADALVVFADGGDPEPIARVIARAAGRGLSVPTVVCAPGADPEALGVPPAVAIVTTTPLDAMRQVMKTLMTP